MRRTFAFVSVFALVLTMIAVPASATHGGSHPMVTPTLVAGNDACPYKVDPPNAGTYNFQVGTSTFTVTITRDGESFGFTSNAPVEVVIAKGGPDHNVYDYTGMNVTSDYGLVAPTNQSNGQPYGLSHISFCFGEPFVPQGALIVNKTAEGDYDRTVEWDLEKKVKAAGSPDSALVDSLTLPATGYGLPGDTFPVQWNVAVTKTDSGPQNLLVTGEIEVAWSGANYDVTVTVSDSLPGAVIDCDPLVAGNQTSVTLEKPADSVTCSYSVAVASQVTTNTATATPTATANPVSPLPTPVSSSPTTINWTEDLTGFDSATLTDPRFAGAPWNFVSEVLNASATRTFDETFTCPTDRSLYVDGIYEQNFPNTAYLNGNLNLDDSADVTIKCQWPEIFEGETAWAADGNVAGQLRYTPRGNWATYVTYGGTPKAGTIFAGQTTPVGTYTMEPAAGGQVRIVMSLSGGWILDPEMTESVKIQGYASAPSGNPSPGLFTTYKGTELDVTVDAFAFYGIHLNVGKWMPAP